MSSKIEQIVLIYSGKKWATKMSGSHESESSKSVSTAKT